MPKSKLQLLSVEHGLSQSVVNDLLIDSKGFLWVGTQNGLNRFDGYSFKVFYNNPQDKYTISSNFINCLAEDATDNLWVGTRRGLNKYDYRTQEFIHYGLPLNKLEFPQINIRSLLVDSENILWILLPDYLLRVNPVDEKMDVYALDEVLQDEVFCVAASLYESSSGNIWFVEGANLVMFDKVFEKFEYFNFRSEISHGCFIDIFENDKSMYVTTESAVYKMVSSSKIDQVFVKQFNTESFSVFPYRDQMFMISNSGVYALKDNKFELASEFVSENETTLRNFISVADVDGSGNLWIGTNGKGLMETSMHESRFESITLKISENNFLSDDQVSAIWVDPDFLWIGTYEYGLNIINRNTNEVELLTTDLRPDVLKSNNVYDICLLHDRYFIATGKGFSIIKRTPKGLVSETHSQLSDFNGHVYDILSVGDSLIYYSFGGVLYRYNVYTERQKSWTFDVESETGLTNSFSIEHVQDDFIFVGTSYGLFRFDLRNEYWDRFLFRDDDPSSISGNDVYALDYDSNGHLWIGTSSGGDFVNDPFAKSLKFNRLPLGDKYTVYSIVAGEDNTWIGTGNGLVRYSMADSVISFFTMADGLPCNEFNIGAIHRMDDDMVAFGGQGGVVLFNVDSVQLSDFNPYIELSETFIYSRKGKREVPVYSGVIIDLEVADFLINIHFTSLDYTSTEKILYRYKVNGSNWVEIGQQNYASFSNMQPGVYKIEINGTNADRIWSSNIAYVTLVVPSPWYSSWWAYVFYAALILVLVLFVIETRTRRLRLTNQVLREKEATAKQVSKQKDRLMTLHKDVTESLNYASRIQRALFPASSTFKRILPHSFAMHRPKDIISGDFYWVAESGSKAYVAVVDCTGHGVPGALMSVIGVELLKRIVLQDGYTRPAEVLNQLTAGLNQLFSKDEEDNYIADGMDMGLCIIDRETLMLEYSGAINSLYRINGNNIEEIKGDRMPVGVAAALKNYMFTNHIVDYSEDDMFYMATDGYPDQFGGNDNKKYKYTRFRNFLISISKHDMDLQQLLLENNFDKWRGLTEQVDDVLVVGFRPMFF